MTKSKKVVTPGETEAFLQSCAVVCLQAKHDPDGNPRRLYVVYRRGWGNGASYLTLVGVARDLYNGYLCLDELLPGAADILKNLTTPFFQISVKEYRSYLERGKNAPPLAKSLASWAAWQRSRQTASRTSVPDPHCVGCNKEGLTLEEWIRAAGTVPESAYQQPTRLLKLVKAWRAGEDPTEHRATP